MKIKKPSKKVIAGIVAAACVCVACYIGVANAEKENESEIPLREYTVKRGDITAGITGNGSLSYDAGVLNFPEPVQLKEYFVKNGTQVKAGDKLAAADPEWLGKQIEEAQAELEKAKNALDQAQNAKTVSRLNQKKANAEADAALESTQSAASGAQKTVDSLRQQIDEINGQIAQLDGQIAELEAQPTPLPGDGQQPDDSQIEALRKQREELATQKEALQMQLEEAQAALSGALSAQEQQEQQRSSTRGIDEQIESASQSDLDSTVKNAKIDVDLAQKKLDRLNSILSDPNLYADRDGVVLSLGYAPGQETTPDKSVVDIGDPASVFVQIPVAQTDIGNITEGQDVDLTLDAFGDRPFKGKVIGRSLVPVKDSNPVSYPVHVSIDPEDAELLSGMTANAQFIIKQKKDVLQLSNKAISIENGKQYVQMQNEDGTLRKVEIQTGFSDGKVSEITGGLSEGDIAVVEG